MRFRRWLSLLFSLAVVAFLLYVNNEQGNTITKQSQMIQLLQSDAMKGQLCRDYVNPAQPTMYRARK